MSRPLDDLSILDVFLSTSSQTQNNNHIIQNLKDNNAAMPLLSWDLFMLGNRDRAAQAMKNADTRQVLAYAKRFNWQNDIVATFADNDYEALIITDNSQNILWVNDGFTAMTGYAKKEAINNTPRFLQGPATSLAAKKRIKSKLALDKPFQEVIINHRKDKSTYKCQVKIFPLYGEETTHYIAFERLVG